MVVSCKGKEFGISFLGWREGLVDDMVHSGVETLCLIWWGIQLDYSCSRGGLESWKWTSFVTKKMWSCITNPGPRSRAQGSRPMCHEFSCYCERKKVKVLVVQSCQNLCDPMDCGPPDTSVHGVLQARVLECIPMPFSRGSSQPRDRTWVSCIGSRFFTVWATREALL